MLYTARAQADQSGAHLEDFDSKQIGKDVDHLVEGGIYSVLANQYGSGDFVVAKIVNLSASVVHVVFLQSNFKSRPTTSEVERINPSMPSGLNESRERHVALSRKLFSLIRPVFIKQEELSENDLAGFRRWSLMPEKEIIEAPTYIKPEANQGVYLRIFLYCGLPFGLLQGVYHYFRDGLIAGVCAFLFGFAIFGVGMVATQHLAVHHRLRSKKEKSNLHAEIETSASAFQVAEVELNKGFGDTFALCQQAIRTVKNCRVLEEDFSGGTVEGKVGFSLTSEGEHIILTTYVIAPGLTGVVVASVPRVGGEVDLGKNFDNVARIVSHLKTACK